MSFLEQARYHGYPVMHHIIETNDGYLLDLYRIPGKKNENLYNALEAVKVEKRKPVLFIHGLFGVCHSWVANGPDMALGFIVPETGKYDAWYINLRGSVYSRAHTIFDPDVDPEFWDYSFEEFGS